MLKDQNVEQSKHPKLLENPDSEGLSNKDFHGKHFNDFTFTQVS